MPNAPDLRLTKDNEKTAMATRLQVTCINKTEHYSAHQRIRNIGGTNWKHKKEDAISYIENRIYSYFVKRGGYEADVIVAERLGHKYLKTENDGEHGVLTLLTLSDGGLPKIAAATNDPWS